MIKRYVRKLGEIISKIIIENTPFFIFLGILNFFPKEYIFLRDLKEIFAQYILPIVVSYNSGKLFEKKFGGMSAVIVMGGILTLYNFTSFLGPIFVGCLAGILIREYRKKITKYVYPGYEMLLNNMGTVLVSSLLLYVFIWILPWYKYTQEHFIWNILKGIFTIKFLPLFSIIIEPAKIFFLNNIINHGILSVLGLSELREHGKSIFFLMETNPGPGVGILLAYYFTERENGNKKKMTETLSNVFIHFVGGIHEVYFPYVLKKMKLISALVCGGMTGVYIFSKFGTGLVGVASPGSALLLLILAPLGDKTAVVLGILASGMISFSVAYLIIKNEAASIEGKNEEGEKPLKFLAEREDMKKDKKIRICVVCDAGMGSSAMGATLLRRKLEKTGLENISVENAGVDNIPDETDLVIVHKQLVNRIHNDNKWDVIIIDDFMDSEFYANLANRLRNQKKVSKEINIEGKTGRDDKQAHILKKTNIRLGLKRVKKEDALQRVGEKLWEEGYVEKEYAESILRREKVSNTYLGMGIAIPHGDKEGIRNIKGSGIVIDQYPYGIDYGNGETVYLVIGIAALKDEHIKIISRLAEIIEDVKISEQLSTIVDVEEVYQIFLSLEDE